MIVPVSAVDIRVVPGMWPMPEAMRAGVAKHWRRTVAANPNLWDGRMLAVSAPGGAGGVSVVDGVLAAEAREDDYSAYLTWRALGFPEIGIRNLFGTALIAGSDGAMIFGVMGNTTVNPGQVYPPGGGPEPRDVTPDGRLGMEAMIARELVEETGLDPDEARIGGMIAVFDGPRISLGRFFHFDETAERLAARIRGNLERQQERELADVVVVRSVADVVAAGPSPHYARMMAGALAAGELG